MTNKYLDSAKREGCKGFTLIEVLMVIGIIAVLASVALVAINPGRQFKLARDSQRTANVNAIINALGQNMSEHKGQLFCGGSVATLPATSTNISSTGFDLAACVVPDYISSLPFDPSASGAHYTSQSSYDTKYTLYQESSGHVKVVAVGEIEPSISVSR
jgi:type IV pilus assembly protein PilA